MQKNNLTYKELIMKLFFFSLSNIAAQIFIYIFLRYLDKFDLENPSEYTAKQLNPQKQLNIEHIKASEILDQFGTNLNQLYSDVNTQFNPIVGRDKEVDEIIRILLRKTKNNPMLIGEPGVGKTAIAESLAQRILTRNVPKPLLNKQVFSLDAALCVSDTKYRGQMEQNIEEILTEINNLGNVILFIDEIHTLIGGESKLTASVGELLKPALARGGFLCIGATTLQEYSFIENDKALERRFIPVRIEEPSIETTIKILKALKQSYQNHHEVIVSNETIESVVNLADKFIKNRYFPDKAIDLLDRACVLVYIKNQKKQKKFPLRLQELNSLLEDIVLKKHKASNSGNYELANDLKREQNRLQRMISWQIVWNNPIQNMDTLTQNIFELNLVVRKNDIIQTLEKWKNIPINVLLGKIESLSKLELEKKLNEHVIGQQTAVSTICKNIECALIGFKTENQPIASFLFCGPTGVGKTEMARSLAKYLFNSKETMIRFDMSEFMTPYSTVRLIGSQQHRDGGELTKAVFKNPYSIVLLDEIEKAHPNVLNLFLQILDDGRLTDANGRTVDFTNVIIVMTSNIGAPLIQLRSEGYLSSTQFNILFYLTISIFFRPEILNRLDNCIIFEPLSEDSVSEIADILIKQVIKKLHKKGITLKITDQLKNHIIKRGYDPNFGARPLKRAITDIIENFLANQLLSEQLKKNDLAIMNFDPTQNTIKMMVFTYSHVEKAYNLKIILKYL